LRYSALHFSWDNLTTWETTENEARSWWNALRGGFDVRLRMARKEAIEATD
jgi:hypothetical protein